MRGIMVGGGIVVLIALAVLGWQTARPRIEPQQMQLTQQRAIEAIITAHPELGIYQTSSLPPRRIDTESTATGWRVGFITEGSGLRSILDAHCFFVAEDTTITTLGSYRRRGTELVEKISLTTCAPTVSNPETPPVLPYGSVTLRIAEQAQFLDLSLIPLVVVEDSRCPRGVQCIQAGTVRVQVRVTSSMGISTQILKLGESLTTEAEVVTFAAVSPEQRIGTNAQNSRVPDAAYQLTFTVQKRPLSEINPQLPCYVGGCSRQICSDQKDVASTCEFRAEYACYEFSRCERQQSGSCGWTPTPELTQCLATR